MKKCIIVFFLFSLSCAWALPPRHIPESMVDAFTMNGSIPVLDGYRDDSYSGKRFYWKKHIDSYIQMVHQGLFGYYRVTDKWLYDALHSFPIKGKSVLIIGSARPWYESIVLAYGGHPVTVEYNDLSTDDPRLEILNIHEYEKSDRLFDVILSISSIEHDGLGRYGDPIDPIADFKCMERLSKRLNPKGYMFLAVPMGKDAIIWNACRIYGSLRFPKLIEKWEVVRTFGYDPTVFQTGKLGKYTYQPIFVLTPKK